MGGLILASASPRRSGLLRQLGLDFRIMPPDTDETSCEAANAVEFAMRLSYNKAANIASKVESGCLVIGADTVVVRDGILGKPSCRDEASEMLKKLSGCWHEVITGLSVLSAGSGRQSCTFEKTLVKMKDLSDSEISAYIDTGEPLDKAGAYGIQGMGALLVERIDGCYYNVVGLPLFRLSVLLGEFGMNPLERSVPGAAL